jgi:hypothetical protein
LQSAGDAPPNLAAEAASQTNRQALLARQPDVQTGTTGLAPSTILHTEAFRHWQVADVETARSAVAFFCGKPGSASARTWPASPENALANAPEKLAGSF